MMTGNGAPSLRQLPAQLKQEIHFLLALHCRELLLKKKGGGAKSTQQFEFLEKVYYGNSTDHQSVLQLFLDGKNPYSCCFDKLEIQSNREGNEFRTEGFMLCLKDWLHLIPSAMFCVHEGGFDVEGLSVFRNKRVTGRKLNDNALECIKIYKHALAAEKIYMGNDDVGPSGKTLEDMLLFVRKALYVKYNGAPDPKAGRNRQPVASDGSDMPSDYIFKGFLGFVVFGPWAISKTSLSCLSEDMENVPKQGRAQARKEAAADADGERATGEGGYVPDAYKGRRGVTLQAKASVANIVQRENMSKRKNVADLLFVESSSSRNTLDEIASVRQGIRDAQADGNSQLRKFLQKHLLNLYDALGSGYERKQKLQKMSVDYLDAKTPMEITAYVDQVGQFKTDESTGTTPSSAVSQLTEEESPASQSTQPSSEEEAVATQDSLE